MPVENAELQTESAGNGDNPSARPSAHYLPRHVRGQAQDLDIPILGEGWETQMSRELLDEPPAKFQHLLNSVMNDKDGDIVTTFGFLQTNYERIRFVKALDRDDVFSCSVGPESAEKSLTEARLFRRQGDDYYNKRNLDQAFRCYTKAILKAPWPTKNIPEKKPTHESEPAPRPETPPFVKEERIFQAEKARKRKEAEEEAERQRIAAEKERAAAAKKAEQEAAKAERAAAKGKGGKPPPPVPKEPPSKSKIEMPTLAKKTGKKDSTSETPHTDQLKKGILETPKLQKKSDIVKGKQGPGIANKDKSVEATKDTKQKPLRKNENTANVKNANEKNAKPSPSEKRRGKSKVKVDVEVGPDFVNPFEKKAPKTITSEPPPEYDPKPENNELAIAFANRSAVLITQRLYEACIDDIKSAIFFGYAKENQSKLLDRQARATNILAKKEDTSPILPTIDGKPSTKYGSASQKFDVKFVEREGRTAFAADDINSGDVVIVEKPYASILNSNCAYTHCQHCLTKVTTTFPCRNCSAVVYCNAKCSEASWDEYHEYECQHHHLLCEEWTGVAGQLALRLAIVFIDDVIHQKTASMPMLDKLSKKALQKRPSKWLLNAGYSYQTNYETMCNLVTHDEDRDAKSHFQVTAMALFLGHIFASMYMVRNSGRKYFYRTRDLQEEVEADELCWDDSFIDKYHEQQEIAASVVPALMEYLKLIQCNSVKVNEIRLGGDSDFYRARGQGVQGEVNIRHALPHPVGCALYTTLSLVNHSCDPNLEVNYYGATAVVRAVKDVPKDGGLFTRYAASFLVQGKTERQNYLKSQYFFTCACSSCTNDWPLMKSMESELPEFLCPGRDAAEKAEKAAMKGKKGGKPEKPETPKPAKKITKHGKFTATEKEEPAETGKAAGVEVAPPPPPPPSCHGTAQLIKSVDGATGLCVVCETMTRLIPVMRQLQESHGAHLDSLGEAQIKQRYLTALPDMASHIGALQKNLYQPIYDLYKCQSNVKQLLRVLTMCRGNGHRPPQEGDEIEALEKLDFRFNPVLVMSDMTGSSDLGA